ncbi:TetR/AcrR family transcriptional regulator [Cupriavidus sp. AU9028]|uniref:TetR/AcrR family transcriptional regulator n=1 Tax=Cupriavidus sp. AU9028 TaxID=2871157 RepID=UPI001C9524CE|nr:TetR/AcrR family transcriptional regulator [Cupriavidus sp. AU9028]MBY4897091.1 TetR family transcriptional regulator [Cupriavidus sp. AU9028]
MSRGEAPTRVLDAAEALFAQRGYHGVSLRQIAQEANLAVSLVQYHFTNKEELFGAVLGRRIAVINHERLSRLDAVEQRSDAGRPRLEDVLRAFLEPTLLFSRDQAQGGPHYAQLIAQISNDPQPHARRVSREHMDPIARQTIRVLAMALPHMDEKTLTWCYLFAVGAMVSAISPAGRVRTLSGGRHNADDITELVELLATFLTGAFRAVDTAASSQTP